MLGKLARQHDPNVLVGFDHADDAGVYQIAPDQALVQTVDFFTPVVDDPYTFGQIAATNALSDIYAMGGKPLTALALVCFPEKADLDILERILAGGLSKMIEAACFVIGGHSIRDDEPKFGYAVTGLLALCLAVILFMYPDGKYIIGAGCAEMFYLAFCWTFNGTSGLFSWAPVALAIPPLLTFAFVFGAVAAAISYGGILLWNTYTRYGINKA